MIINDKTKIIMPYGYKSEVVKIADGISKSDLKKIINKKTIDFGFNEDCTITFLGKNEAQIIELEIESAINLSENINIIPVFSIARKIASDYKEGTCIVYLHMFECVVTIRNGFLFQYRNVRGNKSDAESYIKRLLSFNNSRNDSSVVVSDIKIESLDIEKLKFDSNLLDIRSELEKLKSINKLSYEFNKLKGNTTVTIAYSLTIAILISYAIYKTYEIENTIDEYERKLNGGIDSKISNIEISMNSKLNELIDNYTELREKVENNNSVIESTRNSSINNSSYIEEFNSVLSTLKTTQDEHSIYIGNINEDKRSRKRKTIINKNPIYNFSIKMVVGDTVIVRVRTNSIDKLARLGIGQTIKIDNDTKAKLISLKKIVVMDNKNKEIETIEI